MSLTALNDAITLKVNERVVSQGYVPKKIHKLNFGVFSSEEMRKLSHIQVIHQDLYKLGTTESVPYGALDGKLGTSSKSKKCQTCGLPLKDCVGHFGYLKLELPVFHIGFLKNTIEILQRICKNCSRVILSDIDRLRFLEKLRKDNLEVLQRSAIEKEVLNECKKVAICPHCGCVNGQIKKISSMKIVHEKYKQVKAGDVVEETITRFKESFETAVEYNPEIKNYISKATEDITPIKVLDLFERISEDDIELLNMHPKVTKPELLIMTHLLVPPLCIRPSIPSDIGTNEDDLTVNLIRIIHQNQFIKQCIEKGQPMEVLMETWDNLQLLCAYYINSELPGFPQHLLPSGPPARSFVQRLKGKHGRFRGNLSGKRVDFSGRTVISPDPNLKIDQVAVPELVAKVLTFPEKVNSTNIYRLRDCVKNGPDLHPGANFVQAGNTSDKRSLKFGDREAISKNLRIGDTVERHLCDDDIVLFNRQPSLHRLSIMAHRAKILPYRTFRFNECVCSNYNADFDGDEMNLHVPQTEEARAEALNLMGVKHNMITPKNGEPLVSCTQDFITGSFLMSRKNTFFDRSQFCNLCQYMDIEVDKIDLPPPAILKPMELWTGKQLFSLLIKPNDKTEVYINLEAKAKNYSGKDKEFCVNDGYVLIRNSYIISGTLDKKLVGDGTKNSLFFAIIKNYGIDYAAECMSRFSKVTVKWLMNFGFSIGISDVKPSKKVTQQKRKLLDEAYVECAEIIRKYNEGKLEPQPGCNEEQTVEAILNGILSNLRQTAGNMCLKELHWQNAPLTMALCGSKGSTINISQMVALVGQQTVNGSRIANGFMDRTLPHFKLHSRAPFAKGFVEDSFFTGLTPTEFFFHTMAGREGLVDTAVKSVVGETPVVIIENNKPKYVKIGDWIDDKLEMNTDSVEHYTERQMELLKLQDKVYIPTMDYNGVVSWGEMTAITRHDPGTELYEIKTLSGKSVTVTESKSLLTWNKDLNQFKEVLTPSIKIGDYVPATAILVEPPIALKDIDMSSYFSQYEFIYGTEFNKACKIADNDLHKGKKVSNDWWKKNNGVEFTLPSSMETSLTRALCCSGTEHLKNGCIYPFYDKKDYGHILDTFDLSLENGIFIGLVLSNGKIDTNTGIVEISNTDASIREFVKNWFKNNDIEYKEIVQGIESFVIGHSRLLSFFLSKITGNDVQHKYVPNESFVASEDFIKGLLNGYFSGSAFIDEGSIKAESTSIRLLEGISMLCSRLGIFGRVCQKEQQEEDTIPVYSFMIVSMWTETFSQKIKLIQPEKEQLFKQLDSIDTEEELLIQNDVVLDKIVEINIIDVAQYPKVYDVTVPSTLNFSLANGLQVRDTAETGYMQRRLVKALEDLHLSYDNTVRNSVDTVVQFSYGDDGLDPYHMDADDGRPVNFDLLLMHVQNTNNSDEEKNLTIEEIKEITKEFLKEVKYEFSIKFTKEIREYIDKFCSEKESYEIIIDQHEYTDLSKATSKSDRREIKRGWKNVRENTYRMTETQLKVYFEKIREKYRRSMTEPGTAVGAIAAQSIGEPGTQMTLKTFHFAGVASMNVTLGVPRIVEIINATRNISTPIITAELINNDVEASARIIKGRIEKTILGQVSSHIREVYDVGICYIDIKLDLKILRALQLEITPSSVKEQILNHKKIGISENHIKTYDKTIRVYPPSIEREDMYFEMQRLKKVLSDIIVCGIPTIQRAVINIKEEKPKKFNLLVEGTDLLTVMGIPGVYGKKTTTNNILEIEETLGIEAARHTIMSEIHYTMSSYGMSIDYRHMMLLGDVMSFKGEILGITRFGISKMRDSVLMLASFEKTTDHLFDASVHSRVDDIAGVSECIILGIPMSVGTGLFKLIQKVDYGKRKKRRKPLFFNKKTVTREYDFQS